MSKKYVFRLFLDSPTYFLVGGRDLIHELDAKNVHPFPQAPNPLHFLEAS
jgi:hypothetical protein